MEDVFKNQFIKEFSRITGMPEEETSKKLMSPPDTAMGELACSGTAPCQLPGKPIAQPAVTLGANRNDNAKAIATAFRPNEYISSVESVGIYVNARYNRSKLIEHTLTSAFDLGARYGSSAEGAGKTVVIDYSSPNIAKPFGIGHLRSTVIGGAIKRIYDFLGYKTVGVNHLGDWGTQFGKMIVAFKKWGDPDKTRLTVGYLNELYIRFHEESEKDPSLETAAQEWFLKLEQGDPEAKELWQRFKDISLDEFKRVYAILGASFDSYAGESFYNDKMEPVIEEIASKGLAKESQGALIVDLEKFGMSPCLLRKGDGATLYATRDLAAALYRHATYKFDKLIYVVGSDQNLHFRQLFKVLELMGKDWAANCHHVNFGLIRFKGEKMSTRKGKSVLLEDVLDMAIDMTRNTVKNREMNDARKEQISVAVGTGAVIFNDLKNKRAKDIDFDWQQVLNYDQETGAFKGETGPYLQYTHTRLSSIARKYDKTITKAVDFGLLKDDLEFQIAFKIYKFPEIVSASAKAFEPSLISNYLLDLSSLFSRYWHDTRIMTEDEGLTKARMLLSHSVRMVLSNGLSLLGVAPLEEM